jgi:hypothetical protein
MTPAPRVRLVHWHPIEAQERVARLKAAGFRVEAGTLAGQAGLRELRARPPDVIAIDLGRLPAQGRDLGVALRQTKATRWVPLVYVGGEPEKVAAVKRLLPDAVFTTWTRAPAAVRRAIATRPAHPVVPSGVFAGYSGVPLARKLGIKPGWIVGLVEAPPDFASTVGELPAGASLRRGGRGAADLVIWFVRSRSQLERRIVAIAARAGAGGLWIAWPKQRAGVSTGVTQADVRRVGLASGLVDYKICAIDMTWSGLRFARRAKAR